MTNPLTAADRCDRCGAQAYAVSDHGKAGQLKWCAHHLREHADRLAPFLIWDETAKLKEPVPS